jgi:hypothetical protein
MKKILISILSLSVVACASFTADNCLVLPPITCNSNGATYTIRACAAPGSDISNDPAFKAGVESSIAVTNQSCHIQK